ncbi:MAG: alanine racemase [Acidimicrobiia bacterium]|nr:alanine racemase [Acidimicrobiia bacterium]
MEHFASILDTTRHLATPFLAIDQPAMTRNISRVQAECDGAGIALRPHIKTHKSVEIARRQLEAGAVGVTCATLSEAVALGEAGCATDVYVSTPIHLDGPKVVLLARAAELHARVTLTADGTAIAVSVTRAAPPGVGVMVEVDCGLRRTGAAPDEVAGIVELLGDRFRGFATHGGHGYLPGGAEAAGRDERAALAAAQAEIGGQAPVLSAGSTPTAPHALGPPVTELRPGTYVFGDHQQFVLGACRDVELAAVIVSSVIHVSADRFVIDAGAKALSKDRAGWLESYGSIVGHGDAVIDRLNDNHGMVEGGARLSVGDRVMVVPNHICPAVNLFDEIVLVGDGTQSLPIELRGRVT